MYINNNGNITFNAADGAYTPDPFPASTNPMMAPWWADVYTLNTVAVPPERESRLLGHSPGQWPRANRDHLVLRRLLRGGRRLDTFQIVIRETTAASGTTPADYTGAIPVRATPVDHG